MREGGSCRAAWVHCNFCLSHMKLLWVILYRLLSPQQYPPFTTNCSTSIVVHVDSHPCHPSAQHYVPVESLLLHVRTYTLQQHFAPTHPTSPVALPFTDTSSTPAPTCEREAWRGCPTSRLYRKESSDGTCLILLVSLCAPFPALVFHSLATAKHLRRPYTCGHSSRFTALYRFLASVWSTVQIVMNFPAGLFVHGTGVVSVD